MTKTTASGDQAWVPINGELEALDTGAGVLVRTEVRHSARIRDLGSGGVLSANVACSVALEYLPGHRLFKDGETWRIVPRT